MIYIALSKVSEYILVIVSKGILVQHLNFAYKIKNTKTIQFSKKCTIVMIKLIEFSFFDPFTLSKVVTFDFLIIVL